MEMITEALSTLLSIEIQTQTDSSLFTVSQLKLISNNGLFNQLIFNQLMYTKVNRL